MFVSISLKYLFIVSINRFGILFLSKAPMMNKLFGFKISATFFTISTDSFSPKL